MVYHHARFFLSFKDMYPGIQQIPNHANIIAKRKYDR